MKYKLREQFSIHNGKEVVVGPCDIELSAEEATAHAHKLEAFQSQNKFVADTKELNAKALSKAVEKAESEEKVEESKPSKGKK